MTLAPLALAKNRLADALADAHAADAADALVGALHDARLAAGALTDVGDAVRQNAVALTDASLQGDAAFWVARAVRGACENVSRSALLALAVARAASDAGEGVGAWYGNAAASAARDAGAALRDAAREADAARASAPLDLDWAGAVAGGERATEAGVRVTAWAYAAASDAASALALTADALALALTGDGMLAVARATRATAGARAAWASLDALADAAARAGRA